MSLAVTAVYTLWHWPVGVCLAYWCIGNRRTWKDPPQRAWDNQPLLSCPQQANRGHIQEAKLLSNMERIHCQVLWHYIHFTSLWENCGIQCNISLPYRHAPFYHVMVTSKANMQPWEVELSLYHSLQLRSQVWFAISTNCSKTVTQTQQFYYSHSTPCAKGQKRCMCYVKQYKRKT